MAHVAKYTRSQIGGLTRHFERAKKESGEYQAFGNQEIDIARSHLNYNLAPVRDGGQLGFIKQRVSKVHCLNRADVNVMCSWVVTAPKGLGEDEHGVFFDEVYGFLNGRYGDGSDRNVISAYVHMDETTPHIHYAFVPVVWDEKKQKDKVSAKMVVHRRDLQSFHPDLERHMAEVFGREIGILNEATKDGNRTIEELKRGSALAELQKAQEEMLEIRDEKERTLVTVSNAHSTAFKLRNEVRYLEEQRDGLEGQIRAKGRHIKIAQDKLGNLMGELGVLGDEKEQTLVSVSNMREMALELGDYVGDLKNERDELEGQISEMRGQLEGLEEQIEPMQQNLARLTAVNAEYKAKRNYIARARESSDISMMYPDYVKVSKKVFGNEEYITVPKDKWEDRHVSANEVSSLVSMRKSLEKSMSDFVKSQSGVHYGAMKDKIQNLEGEVKGLKVKIRRTEEKLESKEEQLLNKTKENENLIARINRILGKIDGDEAEKFVEAWRVEEVELELRERRRGDRGYER